MCTYNMYIYCSMESFWNSDMIHASVCRTVGRFDLSYLLAFFSLISLSHSILLSFFFYLSVCLSEAVKRIMQQDWFSTEIIKVYSNQFTQTRTCTSAHAHTHAQMHTFNSVFTHVCTLMHVRGHVFVCGVCVCARVSFIHAYHKCIHAYEDT